MSGFVGILHLDSSPVDRLLIQRMTDRLAFRGPDASGVHVDGSIGLGHTLLRTSPEARQEQPCSLDGEVWIVSDARIDGRTELLGKLQARGHDGLEGAPDVELILHAYAVWGEECARHLLGDFSFAIWDRPKQRLFCARDHFGVRPFYYAQRGDCLVFSNTLECVRSHPSVSDTLNEQFIGDFLLFGVNLLPAVTIYSDIQRLPGAHTLTYSTRHGLKQERYWSLPTDGIIRYKRHEEYVEHFSTLFRTAVQDRIRSYNVSVLMSGGLDSAAVAATARSVMPRSGILNAVTIVYDRLMPDQERYYAGLVAQALDISIQYQAADDYELFEHRSATMPYSPEPIHNPLAYLQADHCAMVAAQSRVALSGYGGDPVLCPSRDHFLDLIKHGRIIRFGLDIAQYKAFQGRLPPLFLRTRLSQWLKRQSKGEPPYPIWLNNEFATRLQLSERFKEINAAQRIRHPVRPVAYEHLIDPFWNNIFDRWDSGSTWEALEVCHPFFDLRLINYALSIPPMPYCSDKAILRSAMSDLLPDEVRRRPKTPLVADPLIARLRQCSSNDPINLDIHPEIHKYIDKNAIPPVAGGTVIGNSAELWLNLRPQNFSNWLRIREASKENYNKSASITV